VVSVSTEHRLKRLRDLLHELERLPATAERDRMIREVRARVVDVDTGVLPSALLPVYPDSKVAAEPGSPITPAPRLFAAMPAEKVASLARAPLLNRRNPLACRRTRLRPPRTKRSRPIL